MKGLQWYWLIPLFGIIWIKKWFPWIDEGKNYHEKVKRYFFINGWLMCIHTIPVMALFTWIIK